MRLVRSLRFPLILAGTLGAVAALMWPTLRGARRDAQRAGIT